MTARSLSAQSAARERAVSPSVWSRLWTENGAGYLFLLPWFVGFFGLTIFPILSSLYLSFTNFDMLTAPQWVGADNYVRMFTHDPKFAQSMRVTLLFVAFSVPLKLAFALGVALLLNRGMKGLPLYRAVFYLPSLLGASVAIAVLWRTLFAGDGLVNKGLALVGIQGPAWISNPRYSLWTLVALAVWQFGSPMIIFLAGLRQIPQDDRHRRSPRQLRVGRVAASAHTRCPELSDSHDRLSDWARPVRPHINRFDDLYPGYESQRDGETRSCPGIGDADRAESCRPSSKTRKSSGKVLPRPAGRRPIRAGLTRAPGWRVLPGCCCSSSRPSGTPRSPSP